MKLTNRANLPDPIVRAVANDPYVKCKGWSHTRLIAPAWQRKLMREHGDEITEDVSDRIWALIGQAAHVVLERAAGPEAITEKRLEASVAVGGEVHLVHGQIDLLQGNLVDYKITSVWSILDAKENGRKEWEQQLNIQCWLCRQNGLEPEKLQILAIARDWSKRRAQEGNYPAQAEIIEVEKWAEIDQQRFIQNRIKAHLHPTPCTPEERWEKPPVWAVMVKGQKRAKRLLPTREEAVTWRDEKCPGGEIVHRPGESVRCEMYCTVAQWCEFYQSMRKTDARSE